MKMPKWWWIAVALLAVLWINVFASSPTPTQAPPTDDPVENIRAQFHDMGIDTVDLEIIQVPMPTRKEIIEAVPDAAHVWEPLQPDHDWTNTPCDNGAVVVVGVCNSQSSSSAPVLVDVWVHKEKGTNP